MKMNTYMDVDINTLVLYCTVIIMRIEGVGRGGGRREPEMGEKNETQNPRALNQTHRYIYVLPRLILHG